MTICDRCNGRGTVTSIQVGSNGEQVQCRRCAGTGRTYGQSVNPDEMMGFKRQYGRLLKCSTCYAVFGVRGSEQVLIGAGSDLRGKTHEHDLYEIMSGF